MWAISEIMHVCMQRTHAMQTGNVCVYGMYVMHVGNVCVYVCVFAFMFVWLYMCTLRNVMWCNIICM